MGQSQKAIAKKIYNSCKKLTQLQKATTQLQQATTQLQKTTTTPAKSYTALFAIHAACQGMCKMHSGRVSLTRKKQIVINQSLCWPLQWTHISS